MLLPLEAVVRDENTGATDATEANSVEGGGAGAGRAGRGDGSGAAASGFGINSAATGGGGEDIPGATTGGGGFGSEISRSSDGSVSRSVNTGIVASSGITLPPGCVSRSRSVDLRELVAIFHFYCGRLKSAIAIGLEAHARALTIAIVARHNFDHSLVARKETLEVRRNIVVERQ